MRPEQEREMRVMMGYPEFLQSKRVVAHKVGFEAEIDSPHLFDWQRDLSRWALLKGRDALFVDTGLGKTRMQLVWANEVHKHIGQNVLILAPLAVAQQTVNTEAAKINMDGVHLCRSQADVKEGINVANYERLHLFDTSTFGGVVLDESSCLKAYSGKVKQALVRLFAATPYRLCCTATPAPNDLLELGNHSEFLSIMPSNEMISRWFINNSMQAGDYRLKKHAEGDFWRWIASWAMSVTKPSDLGYSDEGFDLPDLRILSHHVDIAPPPPPTGMLIDVSKPSATTLHRNKRHSAEARARAVADLVNADNEAWIVWCDTNYEADALVAAIPEAVEVRGSEPADVKEAKLLAFSTGHARVIITKPDIAGFGLNWQHCANVAFVGLSYSFEKFYQAVRRSWRFGQTRPVNVHVVSTAHEESIDAAVWMKEAQHNLMRSSMVDAVRKVQMEELYGLTLAEYEPETLMQLPEWLAPRLEAVR